MPQLPHDIIQRFVGLLSPFMDESARRKAYLTQAFFLAEPRLHQMDTSGDAMVFTTNCAATLLTYECLQSGAHAASVLLQTVKQSAGVNKQPEFDDLIQTLDAYCSDQLRPPSPSANTAMQAAQPGTLQDINTPQDQRTPTLFISYSSQDRAFADKLVEDLRAAGYACWIDNTEIKGGDLWLSSISEGLINSYAMVSIVSATANKSRWVQREFIWADNNKRPIFPVWCEDTALPFYMGDLQAIKLYDPHYDAGLKRLLEVLPKPGVSATTEPVLLTNPPASAEIEPAKPLTPAERRQLELKYLDKLLLEHRIWQEVYTPMAGVAKMRQRPQNDNGIKRATATIQPIYKQREGLRKRMAEAFERQAVTEERDFSDILDAVNSVRQLVVLGDPGSGKTTTLWRLAADYAEAAINDPDAPIPVFLRLGGLEAHVSVRERLQSLLGEIPLDALLAEKRLALLLDGLNELPADNRTAKIDELKKLVQQAQTEKTIAVVTCRELDYVGEFDLSIHEQVLITPLDPGRIRDFCMRHLPENGEALFWALLGEDAEPVREFWEAWQRKNMGSFDDIWQSDDYPGGMASYSHPVKIVNRIRAALSNFTQSRSMLMLARNPYMLFMITEVYAEEGKLPENRGKLFELFVNYLLVEREGMRPDEIDEFQNKLSTLAYQMQAEQLGTAATRDVTLRYMSAYDLYRASSANLLDITSNVGVRFTHQLLQEYFAARRLDEAMQAGTSANDFWSWDSLVNEWNETAVLLAGLYNTDCTPVVNWLKHANPELTARIINESGASIPLATLQMLQTEWLPKLTYEVNIPDPKQRNAYGRSAGLLRIVNMPLDNRKGVGVVQIDGHIWPQIDWVKIKITNREDNELGSQIISVGEFYFSRYPITAIQYAMFLQATDGYVNDKWWHNIPEDIRRNGSPKFGTNITNIPQVNVCWYDCIAFCRWLNDRLPSQLRPTLGTITLQIRLPYEYEWGLAAGQSVGLRYPWGNHYISGYANVDETENKDGAYYLGSTSVVGIYPQGTSPSGILDMSGNVWEWQLDSPDNLDTAKEFQQNAITTRALRGGAWTTTPDRATVERRLEQHAQLSSTGWGFRVCAAWKKPK